MVNGVTTNMPYQPNGITAYQMMSSEDQIRLFESMVLHKNEQPKKKETMILTADIEVSLTNLLLFNEKAIDRIFVLIDNIKSSANEEGRQSSGYLHDYLNRSDGSRAVYGAIHDIEVAMRRYQRESKEFINFGGENGYEVWGECYIIADDLMEPVYSAMRRFAFNEVLRIEKNAEDPNILSDLLTAYLALYHSYSVFKWAQNEFGFIKNHPDIARVFSLDVLIRQVDKLTASLDCTTKDGKVIGANFAQILSSKDADEITYDLLRIAFSTEFIRIVNQPKGGNYDFSMCGKSVLKKAKTTTMSLKFYQTKYSGKYPINLLKQNKK